MERKTILEMLLELIAFVCASLAIVFLLVLMTYSMTGKEVKVTDITGSLTDLVIAFANIVIALCAVKGTKHWLKPERLKIFREKHEEIKSLCIEIREIWLKHKFKYYDEYDSGRNDQEWVFSEPDRLEFVNKIDVLRGKLSSLKKMKLINVIEHDVDQMRKEYDIFYDYTQQSSGKTKPKAQLDMEPTRLLSQIERDLESTFLEMLSEV